MFSADYYKKTSPNGPSLDSMGVDFNRTIGVIVGAYQTAKKQPFNSAETAGLAEFEIAVADLCHKTPTAKALDTILSSAAMLALGDEASFSPDTRVGIGPAKINYSPTGMVRVVYAIANRTGAPINVKVACGLFSKDNKPLAEATGYTDAVPPSGETIGQSVARSDEQPERASCRIVEVR